MAITPTVLVETHVHVRIYILLLTVPAQVPPLEVTFINDSPRVESSSVEADIVLSRPVQSLMCILKGRSVNLEMDCECQMTSIHLKSA